MKPDKPQEKKVKKHVKSTECGATHSGCPNAWSGSCDRESGHDGSHHCGSCNAYF